MSTPMTHDGLTEWLIGRGWEVQSKREDQHKSVKNYKGPGDDDLRKGISLWCLSPTGYTLSIQAGSGLYCTPRCYAEKYTEVEIAIWKSRMNGDKSGSYIKDVALTSGDSVGGWINFDKVLLAVHTIEDWKDSRGPQIIMKRDDPEWNMEE